MATADVTAPVQEAVVYEMPKVMVGQNVLFFPHAERIPGTEPSVVAVDKVNAKTINIIGRKGQLSGWNVPHMSDPRLRINPHLRLENGAWDYTPADLEEKTAIEALEARVAALEELMTGSKEKKKA